MGKIVQFVMIYTLFFLSTSNAIASSLQSANEKFDVTCDLNGEHGDDLDRVDPDREIQLLRGAIDNVWPNLPEKLQKVALEVGFVINHKDRNITKNFSGLSAEDDSYWRELDRNFFHSEQDPEGTIRTTFTEKFIQVLDLADLLDKNTPRVLQGAHVYADYVIVHELTHSYQYLTAPVRDLRRHGGLKDGLADPIILAEHKQKIEYELDASEAHKTFLRNLPGTPVEDLRTAIRAFTEYAKTNSDDIEGPEARHALLNLNKSNSVVGRYFTATLKVWSEDPSQFRSFDQTGHIIYYGQIVPPEIVIKLKKINDDLENGKVNQRHIGLLRDYVSELQEEWLVFMKPSPLTTILKRTVAPYLPQVEERFNVELERFKDLT